jgi:hypothetical protein
MLNHQILLHELEAYGVRGIANSWFESYLSNCSQFVEITGLETNGILNRYSSSLRELAYGVPQGSIVRLILFLFYINDLPGSVHNAEMALCADDINALVLDRDLESLELKIKLVLKQRYGSLKMNQS